MVFLLVLVQGFEPNEIPYIFSWGTGAADAPNKIPYLFGRCTGAGDAPNKILFILGSGFGFGQNQYYDDYNHFPLHKIFQTINQSI